MAATSSGTDYIQSILYWVGDLQARDESELDTVLPELKEADRLLESIVDQLDEEE